MSDPNALVMQILIEKQGEIERLRAELAHAHADIRELVDELNRREANDGE